MIKNTVKLKGNLEYNKVLIYDVIWWMILFLIS